MRMFLIALSVIYVAGVSLAQSIEFGSNDCPVEIDTVSIEAGNANATDQNPWRTIANDAAPVIEVDIAEAPDQSRIFQRYGADPVSGHTFARPARLCGE